MRQDKQLMAMILGIMGGIPIEIFTEIMKGLGLTTDSALEVLSMMWIPEGSRLLGLLAVLAIGAWTGLTIYLSARILGTAHFPVKTTLIGMTVWSLFFNIFGTLGGNTHIMQNVSGNFVHATAAAIGGACTGLLIKRYLLSEAQKTEE